MDQLTVVREQINKKNGSPSNKDQLMILQNNMADFGAKMKDISINVAGLKEHLQLLQEMDNDNKQNLTKLTVSLFAEHFLAKVRIGWNLVWIRISPKIVWPKNACTEILLAERPIGR